MKGAGQYPTYRHKTVSHVNRIQSWLIPWPPIEVHNACQLKHATGTTCHRQVVPCGPAAALRMRSSAWGHRIFFPLGQPSRLSREMSRTTERIELT